MRKFSIFFTVLFFLALSITGCATERTTTTTRTVTESDVDEAEGNRGNLYEGRSRTGAAVDTRVDGDTTVVETTEVEDNEPGLLGPVGDILAFPFRLIGDIIDFIF
ncbi:MAG: hypothetical protein PHE18_05065 [Candidatus Omnitrophica bacterium]|nr:hypothetical protein [Candidatus Omnitrophota bacterium]MDD5553228.1 hypothetical protein [Candidatus Omnitrophota bacterium]